MPGGAGMSFIRVDPAADPLGRHYLSCSIVLPSPGSHFGSVRRSQNATKKMRVSRGLVANVVFEESCSGDDFGLNCTGL